MLAISGNRLTSSAIVAATLLAIVPSYLPQSWQNFQPIVFGAAAVIVALLAAAETDWVAAVKADLSRSPRRHGRNPGRARVTDPWRSPVARRQEVAP